MDAERTYLAKLLITTGKAAITSNKYEDGDGILDSALYTISRIIRRVATIVRDIPWYGIGAQLTPDMRQKIDSTTLESDPLGQFSWAEDPAEAVDIFVEVLSDPPSRAIIEGILVAYKEQVDFNNEIKKSRSDRVVE
jgi:hypothetical protein